MRSPFGEKSVSLEYGISLVAPRFYVPEYEPGSDRFNQCGFDG